MRRGHNSISDAYQEGVERIGYVLLSVLVSDGPQRTTGLAEAVHSDISTVSRQVTALVKKGWIERTPDPADGRAWQLAATDAGRRVYERIRQRRNEHIAWMLDGWPHRDFDELIVLLERFNTDFDTYLPQLAGTELNTRGE